MCLWAGNDDEGAEEGVPECAADDKGLLILSCVLGKGEAIWTYPEADSLGVAEGEAALGPPDQIST